MDAINNLNKLLNELINKDDINVRITNLSNELLETLKLIENCTSCKKYIINEIVYFDALHKLISEIKSEKEEQKKKEIIYKLDDELIKIDGELNRFVLCEGCKEKKIKKLINKCENEEMARLLYQCKLNNEYGIQWIPFNSFGNIEYLAKGGFGEVSKAKWIGRQWCYGEKREVVLKRIYNSSNNILDILKEVNKKKFNVDIDLPPP